MAAHSLAKAPQKFGDYGAGPNHVLPTGGTARYTGDSRPHRAGPGSAWMPCPKNRVALRHHRLESRGLVGHALGRSANPVKPARRQPTTATSENVLEVVGLTYYKTFVLLLFQSILAYIDGHPHGRVLTSCLSTSLNVSLVDRSSALSACAPKAAVTQTEPASLLSAPIAAQQPHVHTEHGVERPDPFYWPKTEKIRRSSPISRPKMPTLLPNRPPRDFRGFLFEEMLGRFRDRSECPGQDGPYGTTAVPRTARLPHRVRKLESMEPRSRSFSTSTARSTSTSGWGLFCLTRSQPSGLQPRHHRARGLYLRFLTSEPESTCPMSSKASPETLPGLTTHGVLHPTGRSASSLPDRPTHLGTRGQR